MSIFENMYKDHSLLAGRAIPELGIAAYGVIWECWLCFT